MAKGNVLDWMRRPVVVAPMAGGPSTPELVVAAANAGAVGFLAAGYKTPAAMAAEMAAVRAAVPEAFGVNLFVPGIPSTDAVSIAGYVRSLAPHAEAVGAALGEAIWDDDHLDEKVAIRLAEIAAVTDLPQIAAGGIMGPGQVRTALEAGAVAVQCGTAFLRCRESGSNPHYKKALADPRYTTTAMTRAFSGQGDTDPAEIGGSLP